MDEISGWTDTAILSTDVGIVVVDVVVEPVSTVVVVLEVVSVVLVVVGSVDVVWDASPTMGMEPLDMQAMSEKSNMVTSDKFISIHTYKPQGPLKLCGICKDLLKNSSGALDTCALHVEGQATVSA